jgi:hypothetical protein
LGDSLELLDYQSLKGTFNSIHVPVLAPSLQWVLDNWIAPIVAGSVAIIAAPIQSLLH